MSASGFHSAFGLRALSNAFIFLLISATSISSRFMISAQDLNCPAENQHFLRRSSRKHPCPPGTIVYENCSRDPSLVVCACTDPDAEYYNRPLKHCLTCNHPHECPHGYKKACSIRSKFYCVRHPPFQVVSTTHPTESSQTSHMLTSLPSPRSSPKQPEINSSAQLESNSSVQLDLISNTSLQPSPSDSAALVSKGILATTEPSITRINETSEVIASIQKTMVTSTEELHEPTGVGTVKTEADDFFELELGGKHIESGSSAAGSFVISRSTLITAYLPVVAMALLPIKVE